MLIQTVKLHNEELHNWYFSANIITMVNSQKLIGRACSMQRRKEECIQDFVGKPEINRPLENLDVGGRIILK
jgi:hypothetical protein